MASIEQWKLSRAWTVWDEARDPDGADEHIERTCTNLCQLKDGLELNGFLDTLIPGRSQEQQESMVPSYLQGDLWDDSGSDLPLAQKQKARKILLAHLMEPHPQRSPLVHVVAVG